MFPLTVTDLIKKLTEYANAAPGNASLPVGLSFAGGPAYPFSHCVESQFRDKNNKVLERCAVLVSEALTDYKLPVGE